MNKHTTYLYCWASGLAQFGRSIPDGALPIDYQTPEEREQEIALIKAENRAFSTDPSTYPYPSMTWKARMRSRMRLGYTGEMLVPGVPEARTVDEKLAALKKFKAWAVDRQAAHDEAA